MMTRSSNSALLNYINGQFVSANSEATRSYRNPADNTVLGEATESDAADVDVAMKAAHAMARTHGPYLHSVNLQGGDCNEVGQGTSSLAGILPELATRKTIFSAATVGPWPVGVAATSWQAPR